MIGLKKGTVKLSESQFDEWREEYEEEKSIFLFMPDRVFEIRDRVFFPKGPENNRTHHLSLVVKNSQQYKDNLLFRDYLRKDKTARKGYQALKQKLSKKFANDRASYTEAKENFITKILDKARAEKD